MCHPGYCVVVPITTSPQPGQHVRTARPMNHLERDEHGDFLPKVDGRHVVTPIPAGSSAVVVGSESHGMAPFTRWTLRVTLDDGREVISSGHAEVSA